MPKTADKRAQARRVSRVQRAHQEAPMPVVSRRVPPARRVRAHNRGFIQQFPVATTIFVLLLVGLSIFFLYDQHLFLFAPPAKHPPAQATCNLSTHLCNKAPLMTINANKTYTATIKTSRGDIVIQLDAKDTPVTVNNFVFLAQQNYYNNTYFWRIEKPGQPSPLNPTGGPSTLSLIQGGAVKADGKDANNPAGPPGYAFNDEKVVGDYTAGTVAMANHGANTNGAQFFISTGDNSSKINKNYTIFGHVTQGLNIAQSMQPDDKILSVAITTK